MMLYFVSINYTAVRSAESTLAQIYNLECLLIFFCLICKNYQFFMDSQIHQMLLKVVVHKLHLSVRFPCMLSFQIKAQNKSIDCRGNYELLKGVCTPDETLRLEVQLEKKDDKYLEKQAKIIIMMSSSNGKIPAGSAPLELTHSHVGCPQTRQSTIQKCPDKTASISFTYSLEFLRVLNSNSTSKSLFLNSKLSESMISNSSQSRGLNLDYLRTSHQKRIDSSANQISYQAMTFKNLIQREMEAQGKNVQSRLELIDDTDHRSHISRQRSEYEKEISRMKKDFSRKQLEEKAQANQQYSRMKNSMIQVSTENESLRDKLRQLERKDKQQNQTIKQLRQEIERRKQKSYQQEFNRMETQSVVEQEQKAKKQLQLKLKQYQQQIGDLKINQASLQKRQEYKQSSMKQQIDKLNDKYYLSESERQKAVIELNSMLEQLEAAEKKHHLAIKEKEKAHAEDRNKINKKYEAQTRAIDSLKEQLDQKDHLIADLEREIKLLNSKISEHVEEGSELKVNRQSLNYELQRYKQKISILEKEISKNQQIQHILSEQKKRNQQLQAIDQSNKKIQQSLTKAIQQATTKTKQLEEQLTGKSQEISALMTKNYNLTTQLEGCLKQQQNSTQEFQNLSQSNLDLSKRYEELKNKLECLQFKYNQLEAESQEQIAYLIKTKQAMNAEIEELKWTCDKFKESSEDLINKNRTQCNQVLELNRKLLDFEERNNKHENIIDQYKSTIFMANQEKELFLRKERELQDKIRQKNEEIHELNKKMKKIEKQMYGVSQKLKHTQKFYSEKLQSEEGTIKSKQTKLSETLEQISRLQIDMMTKDENVNSIKNSYSKLLVQSDYMKQQLKTLKSENMVHEKNKHETSELVSQLNERLSNANSTIEEEKQARISLSQTLSRKSKEFEDFKVANNTALEQLMLEIGKDLPASQATEFTLLSFPDEKHSSMQVQAFKKRIFIFQKYQNQIKNMEKVINSQEEEISKLKKQYLYKEEELQALLDIQRSKHRNMQSDMSLQKQELLQKIGNLQDHIFEATSQIEKMSIENEEKQAILMDNESYISELNFQIDNYKNQIKMLQLQIKTLKDETVKLKSSFEACLESTTQESTGQMDRLRKQMSENDRKILSLEKTMQERDEKISALTSEVESAGYVKEKLDKVIQQLNSRYNELLQDRKNGVENQKTSEKMLRKTQEKISELESEKAIIMKKLEQAVIEKKKLNEALADQQVSKAQIIAQLEEINKNYQSLEVLRKDSEGKTKNSVEKYVLEIKRLKEEALALNNSLELKNFEISQHQTSINATKQSMQQASQQLQSRKQQQQALTAKILQLKNRNITLSQDVEAARADNVDLQGQVACLKSTISNLEQLLKGNQTNSQTVSLKERELAKLRQEMNCKDKVYQRGMQELKSQVAQAKKDIASRIQREEEQKRKLRDLETLIENQKYDCEMEKKKFEEIAQSQLNKLVYELEGVKEENKLLGEQLQFQKGKMRQQIEQGSSETTQLRQKVTELQDLKYRSESNSSEQLQKIRGLEQQLKKCLQDWNKQKQIYIPAQKKLKEIEAEIIRYQKYSMELEKKNKQLAEITKKRLCEEVRPGSGDLLRQINTIFLKNKSKILSRVGEREREQIVADFKLIHEKLEGAIKSYTIK